MNIQELNTMMSVISDPISNVYKINGWKELAEIQRIIRIMELSASQKEDRHVLLSVRKLASLRLVLSNN